MAVLGAVTLGGCVHSDPGYHDDKVEVVNKIVVNYLNLHSSRVWKDITVFGQKYSEVRGFEPYYLEIPGRNSILFVTGSSPVVTGTNAPSGQATVHMVDLATHQEVHFPAFDSSIGVNFGQLPGQADAKIAQVLTGDFLSITLNLANLRAQYVIDLRRLVFVREEGDYRHRPYYDEAWHHYIYEGGKALKPD